MESYKAGILKKICYSTLVYERINKKLKIHFSAEEIEKMILETLTETPESQFIKTGKNIYVSNYEKNMRITVNSNTYRLITVDKIKKLNRGCNLQIQKE